MNKQLYEAYDQDFYAWALMNADLLRQGRVSEVDVEHIAEELEAMGKSQKRALHSRLAVLVAHLLKWKYQPEKHSRSWKSTIKVQRLGIRDLLKENPSLSAMLEDGLAESYEKARLLAEADTGMDESDFPARCPFQVEQVLDPEFWPE